MSDSPALPREKVVIDASAMVDLLARTGDRFWAVRRRLAGTVMYAPAHFDAEVLSALGRLQRGGVLSVAHVETALDELRDAPVTRHDLSPLLAGAWARRDTVRLADAFYVELADNAGLRLVTTDQRLARAWPSADVIQ
ncbi:MULTISPECIES: type II toxin-antitoxin system VapC family toxin [Mycobacteriaceae]|uniref:type II toxin-antitoxin system VapC family toxin n=1 Tax=Mycobacteriaceae TaxID=1762 RepID=UPI0008019ED3|nr:MULTISPECIES: type II toxin-antitoxin system VapC family toxin [Mycobacteriaceae]MCK0173850.1 PIN domain-containing protein [Mycolicibacterium sp. F2034L]OBB57108.1 ribonuclease [Mycobacterium sp. 852013-51886_SCH5428379]